MDNTFKTRLRNKLGNTEVREILQDFRRIKINSPNVESIKNNVEKLYEDLSNKENGLSARGDKFEVGTTKTLTFLFPELFVIVDSNVKKALHKTGLGAPFNKFWSVMNVCRNELEDWEETHGHLDSLLELDISPTTLTRIFDKCAFVTGKFPQQFQYLANRNLLV